MIPTTVARSTPRLPRLAAAMARASRRTEPRLTPTMAETILYLYRVGIEYGEMDARTWVAYRKAWRGAVREGIRRRHER